MDRVRFGTLGAARITPVALVKPARAEERAELTVVAARDPERARRFAKKHGIPRTHATYEDVLGDAEVDAVYNPLPNSHHAEWTVKALEAGKHVLCEKPFASNAAEARHVTEVADRSGLVVMEAFHWRYHPLAARVIELVGSGRIGTVKHVEAALCFPLVMRNDIRYRWDLAGGAMMDAGCYAVSMLRHVTGEEPEVVDAWARTFRHAEIDRRMEARFRLPGGATGHIVASLLSRTLVKVSLKVTGTDGEIRVFNPVAPQYLHRLTVKDGSGRHRERLSRTPTYSYQLAAFCSAVLEGAPFPTPPADAVKNMEVVDAVYRAAGLRPRASDRGTE